MTEPHEHRPTYWRHIFHLDRTQTRNWTGKHTLVCRHCGKPIVPDRGRKNIGPLLAMIALMALMFLFGKEQLTYGVLFLLLAAMFLIDYWEYRISRYLLLEDDEAEPDA